MAHKPIGGIKGLGPLSGLRDLHDITKWRSKLYATPRTCTTTTNFLHTTAIHTCKLVDDGEGELACVERGVVCESARSSMEALCDNVETRLVSSSAVSPSALTPRRFAEEEDWLRRISNW